jgi:ligand-binding sensor domain-containing protein/signal transduction histidine kinase
MAVRPTRPLVLCALLTGALLATIRTVCGQQLPIRVFTQADGLLHEVVTYVMADSRGFLWFGTELGVSRFDGYRFVNYGVGEGLGGPFINHIIETRGGEIWVATNGAGVARFEPRGFRDEKTGQRMFFAMVNVGPDLRTNRVNALVEDAAGAMWAATDGGLYVRAPSRDTFVLMPLRAAGLADDLYINDVRIGEQGNLWLATSAGVVQRLSDRRVALYRTSPDPLRTFVLHVFVDRQGLVWSTTRFGATVQRPPALQDVQGQQVVIDGQCAIDAQGAVVLPPRPGDGCRITKQQGLPETPAQAVNQARDGRILVATPEGGLAAIDHGAIRVLAPPRSGATARAIAEDHAGHLWLATFNGAQRLARGGFVAYGAAEGLTAPTVKRIWEDRDGSLLVTSSDGVIHRLDGERFAAVTPPLPDDALRSSWLWSYDLQDPSGEWWVGSQSGLLRLSRTKRLAELPHARVLARYTKKDGLAGDDVAQLFIDSRGDLWIGTVSIGQPAITRRNRVTGRFQVYDLAAGSPPISTVVAFAEDRSGAIWAGFRTGGLARLRNGRFQPIGRWEPALAAGLYVDSRGRLWCGSFDGAVRIDDPAAESPTLVPVRAGAGLGAQGRAFVEDNDGRLYIATLAGLTRLDESTGLTRQFSLVDGLPSTGILAAYRDRRGDLWFGTRRGAVRFSPSAQPTATIASPLISGVSVADEAQPLSEFGEREPRPLVILPSANRLQIEFFALQDGGDSLKFQYRLAGADQEWSAPGDQRAVNFARLASGSYRFEVRAVNSAGVASPDVAAVAFRVLPPIWARWWFLSIAAVAISSLVYAAHRYRVAQVLGLERVRSRIATDLHDDIGSSLSQIAILAELGRQRMDAPADSDAEPLGRIASISRNLVDTMGDIVWAINPRRDSVGDLVHRMRRFAADTFDATEIEFEFHAPTDEQLVRLEPDVRRELLLILKESVTNIAKHAHCTRASVDFSVDGRHLRLNIRDNGRGFDLAATTDGNGLASMRRRVAALGGTLEIEAEPGRGTTVTMDVDLRRHPAAAE